MLLRKNQLLLVGLSEENEPLYVKQMSHFFLEIKTEDLPAKDNFHLALRGYNLIMFLENYSR